MTRRGDNPTPEQQRARTWTKNFATSWGKNHDKSEPSRSKAAAKDANDAEKGKNKGGKS